MLVINGISKKIKKEQILDNVSINIADSELFTLVGPITAGKTTLLNIITGTIKADSGEVLLDGLSCLDNQELARTIYGYVPENLGLYDYLTLKEYMELFVELNEMDKDETVFLRSNLIEFAGLTAFENEYLGKLTRAQKVRAAIVRALLHNPKYIILDNPMAGLELPDVYLIKGMLDFLCQTHRTVFMTSENIQLSASISTSIGILDEGRMLDADAMKKVFEKLKEKNIANNATKQPVGENNLAINKGMISDDEKN